MKKHVRSIGAIALALAMAGSAQAVPLSDLVAGGSIQAGDKIFDQWSADWFVSFGRPDLDLANIDVVALHDGDLDPGPGLQFDILNGEMAVDGDGIFAFIDLSISFHVSTDGPLMIKDNSLQINGGSLALNPAFADLGVTIDEIIGTGPGLDDLGEKSVEFSVLDAVETSILNDSAVFAPQHEIWVTKDIFVWATEFSDSASLTGFEQRFSQVPEPTTLALLSLGLVGFGIGRRRKT